MAAILADTVASMSGVCVGVAVGMAARTAAWMVASILGVGVCWQAIKDPAVNPNINIVISKRIHAF